MSERALTNQSQYGQNVISQTVLPLHYMCVSANGDNSEIFACSTERLARAINNKVCANARQPVFNFLNESNR